MLLTGLLLAVFAGLAAANSGARAEAQVPSDRLSVLIFDRESFQNSPEDRDIVNSLLTLIFKLKEGQPFAFAPLDDPAATIGPIETDADDFEDRRHQLDVMLNGSVRPERNLSAALAETYNFLGGHQAGQESVIYFITASKPGMALPAIPDRLGPMVSLLSDASWAVNTVGLPGTSLDVLQVLSALSEDTGGEAFDIGVPLGLREFANRTLRSEAKGALTRLGASELTPNSLLEINLNIAPGTRETNMLFFRESPVTAFRLQNPGGYEASAGDRTSSSFTDAPNLAIWQLVDPVPGQWRLEVRGVAGAFSAWEYSFNKYSLALLDSGTFPLGQPVTVTAMVTEDGERVPLDGVGLIARVTAPDGTLILHELNDNGVSGDAIPGDGYFAATIPPLSVSGGHEVDLELSWPNLKHTITTRGSFDAQPFPALDVNVVKTDDLRPGERARVATIYSHVSGQPFSVLLGDITIEGVTNLGEPGKLELVPQTVITQGRAYMYDLFYTATSETLTTIIARLNLEYAGRQHAFATDSVVLSSVPPLPPPVLAPAPEAPRPVAQPAPPPPPRAFTAEEPAGVPLGLVIALAIVGSIILALVLYRLIFWLTRTTPFGYIYDDRGQVVVDFSNLQRKSVDDLRSRDRIPGHELGVPGLEHVTFAFDGTNVYLSGERTSDSAVRSVRVNNQPLVEKMQIHDNTWIGTAGRLYSFLMNPVLPAQA
jgi:hypothetical protein